MSLPQNDHQSKSNREGSSQLDPLSTRCALITGEGRSAIAVIGIEGPAADNIVEQCVRFASDRVPRKGQIRFGHWVGPANHGEDGESIVLTPMSDQRWEIHCHGGPAAIERILQEMEQSGAAQVSELATDSALVIAEAESVLRRCLTEKTAAIALSQVRGALRDWAMGILAVEDPTDALQQAREGAQSILNSASWTTRLTLPWKIVLVGPPNVGKSSLLNALVGFDRSITYDQAGTTRDVLHADTVIAGVPVRLSDTAGIRDSHEPIEAEGMRRALAAASSADMVVQVSDASAETVDPPIATEVPLIRVINKIDLNPGPTESFDVATSAVTKQGIEELLDRLAAELTRHQPSNDSPVVLNRRQRDLIEEIACASREFPLASKLRDLVRD